MIKNNQQDHIQSLDGLRGFAAFWVFIVHIIYAGLAFKDPFNGTINMGALGVSLFFVLSGFLLGYLYWDRGFTQSNVRSYFVSRFSRIAPAYLFIVISAYFIVHFIDPQYVYNLSSIGLFIRHLLFSGNANALWSIPPEVQFYVFFVLTWYSYQARTRSNVWIIVILMAILMMIIGSIIPKGTLLSTHIQLFLFGALAGRLRKTFSLHQNKSLIFVQIVGLLMTFAYCVYLVKTYNYEKPYHVIEYALLVVVTVFTLSFSTRFTQLTFETAAMRYLGKISFSLYLLNPITIMYAERLGRTYLVPSTLILLGLLVLTIGFSGLMYRWIEMPSQRLIKQHFQSRN